MKKIAIILILLMLSWKYSNAQLKIGPLDFNISFTEETAIDMKGGFRQGSAFYGLEQLSLAVNSNKLSLWKDGDLFAHALNIHGIGPSGKFVGDRMSLSNIEAENYWGLFELWYSQKIQNLVFLAGQHDLNSEFAQASYGTEFLNSSFGVTPEISMNVPVSIYPIAAPCFLIKYSPDKRYTIKWAAYDGYPGNMKNNKHDLTWHLSKKEGFFNIAEIDYCKYETKDIKLGFFYHSGTFFKYDDSTRMQKGNYGMYLILDQPVYQNDATALAFLFEIGISPAHFSFIHYALETGILYYTKNTNDVKELLGLAYSSASLYQSIWNNSDRIMSESALEVFYKFRIKDHYMIQPDFQLIIHPGISKNFPNAFVGLLRFQFSI